MAQLDLFKDELFQKQNYADKKKIVNMYIDDNFAELEDYQKLNDEKKNQFRELFAHDQIGESPEYISPQELKKKQKKMDKIDEYIPDFAEDFVHGAAKNVADYTASGAKLFGADELQHKARLASKTLDKNIDNEYVGMAGEMLGDPLNLTPAGIVSKGTKAVRVAKSVAGGAAIGAGTMAVKDYGNDSLTQDEKNLNMETVAGFVATVNGIIAAVTKGRVKNAIKDTSEIEWKSAEEVTDAITKNPESVGMTQDEAQEFLNATKPKKITEPSNVTSHVTDNGDVVLESAQPKEPTGLDQIDEGFNALNKEIAGDSEEITPKGYVEPPKEVPKEEVKKELTLEQQLQDAQTNAKENLRIAEFRNSIDKPDEAKVFEDEAKRHTQEATRLEEEIQKKSDLEHKANVDEMLKNPRLEELLKMREDVLAKDAQSPQNLVNKRDIQHTNSGDGWATEVTPAQYEKNYNYDFELTKQDVKNIRDGKIDSNTAAKLETDLGTLDNHPDYAPQSNKSEIDYSQYQDPQYADKPRDMSDNYSYIEKEHPSLIAMNGKSEREIVDELGGLSDREILELSDMDYDRLIQQSEKLSNKDILNKFEEQYAKGNSGYTDDVMLEARHTNKLHELKTDYYKKVRNENVNYTDKPKDMSDDDWTTANEVFSKGADNLAVGTYAGLGEDEDGNITLDPSKFDFDNFLLGLGGYTALKTAIKNKKVQGKLLDVGKKVIETVDMNPQVHKENGLNAMFVGSKGTEKGSFSDVATKKTMREIDDSGSVLNVEKLKKDAEADPYSMTEKKLEDVFTHKELLEKYPKLKDVNIVYESPKGVKKEDLYYGASYDKKDNTIILGNGLNNEELHSAILHEIQHNIQDIEGWARGGSVESMNIFIESLNPKKIRQSFRERANLYKRLSKNNTISDELLTELNSDYIKAMKLYEENVKKYNGKTAYELYQSLHGEQLARATQARANMTPEQRQGEDWTKTLERTEGEYKEPIVKFEENTISEMSAPQKALKSEIDDIVQNPKVYKKIAVEVIDDSVAQRIFNETKVNLKGFSRFMDSNHIKHTFKEHSDPVREAKRGQLPITSEDLARVPEIVSSFDKVTKSVIKDSNGKKRTRLVFEKAFDDGTVKYVEAVNFNPKTKEVSLKTMYKKSKETTSLAKFPVTDPKSTVTDGGAGRSLKEAGSHNDTPSTPFSDTIIPQEAEKIKKDKNFKKWFKGSKVVDDKGKPIVVYHGTNTTFDEFKKDFIGRNFDDYSIGFSFSSDAKTAEKYAKNFGEQTKDAQNIMPVYLDIKNPLIMRGEHATMTTDLNRRQIKREIVASRKTDTPYDGIITIGEDGEKHYMVFEPTQIKSINNKGTFDATNPNILHANAGHTLAGAFAGGADSEFNQRDYNGDGVHDFEDVLYGAGAGAVGLNVLKRVKPTWFEDGFSRNEKKGVKLGVFAGDGVTVKNSVQKKFNKGTLKDTDTLPDETLLQLTQRRMQDKFNRVKQLINHKSSMEKIDDVMNPYQAEELMHGKVQAELSDFEENVVTPIVNKIAEYKLTIDDVDEYLWARHAPERNKNMLDLHKKENGSGMSDEDAYKIINKYKDNKQMNEVVQEIYTMNKSRLEFLHKEGLESEEFIQSIESLYDNYVPLRRELGKEDEKTIIGKGFDIAGKEIKRAFGSDKKVESPFMRSILAYEESIARAGKNDVGKSFLKFIEEFPDDTLYSVKNVAAKPIYDKNGAVVGAESLAKRDDNVLHVKVDGKVKEITIEDPALASAFKNLNSIQMGTLLKASHKAVRFIASVNTSYNPEFVVSNFERDIQTAMINIPDSMKKNRLTLVKDVLPAMKGIYSHNVHGTDNEWGKLFNEMKHEGGTTGWSDMHSVQDIKKSTQVILDKHKGKFLPKESAKKVLEYVDNVNDSVENATRLVAYKIAKESGLSKSKAASIAKNITVNFNKSGEMGPVANSLYMFFNASVQGSTRMLSQLKNSKKAQGIVMGIAGAAIGLDTYNRSVNADEYEKIPKYIKDTNFVFMNSDGTYETMMLPYGYNMFKAVGDIAAEAYHREIEIKDVPTRLLSITVNAFSPIGVDADSAIHTTLPTLAKPFYEVETNKNFFGGNIAPEDNPFTPDAPDSQKYFKSVNPVAKSVAQTLNEYSGGNMVAKGGIDISPETIEHIVGFATGGLGRLVMNSETVASQKIDGEEVDMNKVPFSRKFYHTPRKKEEVNLVYKLGKKSATEQLSPLERKRFAKWLKEAVAKKDITAKQAHKLRKSFNDNQRLQDFAKKHNLQSAQEFTGEVKKDAYKHLSYAQIRRINKAKIEGK